MDQQSKQTLNILQVEDNAIDAELTKARLQQEGIPCTTRCVKNARDLEQALETEHFDLIISDFSLPGFNGLAALEIAKRKAPLCPFIFVSGTIGEETAIESLKRGATDYVLKDRPGRIVSAVKRAVQEARELAEKKRLEAQFLRAQRMESIGALAGGMAHDLNNLLAPILISAELLAQDISEEDKKQLLATTKSCAKRASELVKRILSFARGTTGHTSATNVESIISEIAGMAQDTFPRSINVRTKVDPNLPVVTGNATQFHQVLLNLCINARDAMPNGGELFVEADRASLNQYVTAREPKPISGDYVRIRVRDTGSGMSPEVLEKICQPFFTTKPEGKGTGLGLPTVLGIVRNHGGFLEVFSKLAEGTTFVVYLPAGLPNENILGK